MRSTDIAHTTPLRRDLPPFRTGDTVRVHVKITEGEKERIQVFEGVVLRRSRIYYLRELKGKKARLRSKVRDLSGLISEEAADAKNAPSVVDETAFEPGTAAEAAEMEEVVAEETAPEAVAEEATEDSPKTDS